MDKSSILIAVIIAVTIPSLAYSITNRYTIVGTAERPVAYVLDKWTGKTKRASTSENFE
jgi:hypothetical protein